MSVSSATALNPSTQIFARLHKNSFRAARLRDNCVLNLMTRKPTDGRSPARCFSAPKNWLAPLRMKLRTSWGSSAKRAGVRAI